MTSTTPSTFSFTRHLQGLTHVALGLCAGALALTLIGLGGCAAPEVKPQIKLVWPEAPEKGRIEFVRTIVDDKDLSQDTTASQSLFKFLAGDIASKYRIVEPMGIAVSDDTHRVYIADFAQAAVFQFDFEKKVAVKMDGGDKPLGAPMGVALDKDENVYVAETGQRNIRVFDKTGKDLRSITDPSLERPIGIAIDKERGKLYVADSGRSESAEHTVKVFSLDGKLLGKIGKQIGDVEGSFLFPTYVNVDNKGNVYVADTLNSRVQKFDPDGK